MNILKTTFLCFCFSHSLGRGQVATVVVGAVAVIAITYYLGFIDFSGWLNKINFLSDKKTDGVIGSIYTEEGISYLPIMIGGIAGTALIGGGVYYFWPEKKVVVKKGWF